MPVQVAVAEVPHQDIEAAAPPQHEAAGPTRSSTPGLGTWDAILEGPLLQLLSSAGSLASSAERSHGVDDANYTATVTTSVQQPLLLVYRRRAQAAASRDTATDGRPERHGDGQR